MLTAIRQSVIATTMALTSPHAFSVDTTLTPAGYTGLGITPNAHLLGWGRLETAYDRQLPGVVADPAGHNFVVGIGLLPNFEFSGRMAASSLHSNCFAAGGCGPARDLSASAKMGIGLDAANRFRAAVGVTDVGGKATYFRTYYGVLTYNEGPFEVSGGLAKRSASGANRSRSPLHGPFAAAAWQPTPWLRGQIEYTDGNAWAGVRLFAPNRWLPEGWSAYLGANQRLNKNEFTARSWLSAGVSIPLYKVPDLRDGGPKAAPAALSGTQAPLPAYEARTLPAATATAQPAAPTQAPAPASPAPAAPLVAAATDAQLQELATALQAKGLEDIFVGRMADGSIAVRANNATYNWNSLDALGATLGAIANTLSASKSGYRLVLTQRQIPVVAVTGQADCLEQWIANAEAGCMAGQLSTPGTGALEPLQAGATWVVENMRPSWKTLRVNLSPVLRTNVGTEFGVLDYSLGANIGLQMPLWRGAFAEWRSDVELDRSRDYAASGVFERRRVRNGTERLALTQTVRLPVEQWLAPGDDLKARRWGLASVTAQGSIGRFDHHFDGVHGALRWEPGDGQHRVTLQAAYMHNKDFLLGTGEPRRPRPLLASYRYNVAATRTYLEATAGQFFFNDRGFQLGMRQWFTDLSVSAYYKRTKFNVEKAHNFVGVELSLPIGPRRDMNPNGIQVTGTQRFSHGIETTFRETTGNAVRTGYGVMPPVTSPEATFNSDRASLLYFEDNIRRIRDAAR